MKKLALLAISAILAVTLCVNYINKPIPTEDKTQDVPTQVVHAENIVIEMRTEPVTEIKKYGGIAYDFKEVNPIQAK